MDQREQKTDAQTAFRAAFMGLMTEQFTACPATVISYDSVHMTITAQATISTKYRQANGTQIYKATVFNTVPVCFPSGGGFFITWPLHPGDEVLLVFADRCIDNWLAKGAAGGPQLQAEMRIHSQSDGFAIPGPHSYPLVPPNVSLNNLQLRSADGHTLVELTPDGRVNITAPVDVTVTVGSTVLALSPGGINITGNVIVTGTVTAAGFVTPPTP